MLFKAKDINSQKRFWSYVRCHVEHFWRDVVLYI